MTLFTDPLPRSIRSFDGQRFLYCLRTFFGHRVTAFDEESMQIETVDNLLPVAPSHVRKASWPYALFRAFRYDFVLIFEFVQSLMRDLARAASGEYSSQSDAMNSNASA